MTSKQSAAYWFLPIVLSMWTGVGPVWGQTPVAPAAGGAVHLPPGVPIYLSDSQPEPVRRAVKDLTRDLMAVLGKESPILNREDPVRPGIVVADCGGLPGRESHAVFTRGGSVVLQGADVRGTIYAIYTFSEHYLGVPPLWFWSSWRPVHKTSVEIAAGTRLYFPPPHVRWRAWFPNDEDLASPWKAKSPGNFEAVIETILRLKMNTLEGGMMDSESFDHPYQAGREVRLVRDRGLALTGHHMLVFGSSLNHWKLYWRKIRHQEPPPLTIANTKGLEDFWRYHIETGVREKLEMVWLIGFRGNRDIPFWEFFPDAPAGDAERARVIQDMMAREVALLKAVTGNPAPIMRITLYHENSDFFAAGLLHPPTDPTLIWAFVAARRDHFPAADVRGFKNDAQRPVGYYFNFQFTSSGAHLAQAEGPWKMEKNFRMVEAISGRPLEFSVVNAGNAREFLLELSSNARMMWNFDTFRADTFLKEYCSQYFGAEKATRVAALYRDFYNSYWTQRKPDLAGFDRQYVFQDMRYARALEQILSAMAKGRNLNPLNETSMGADGGYFRIVPADNGATSQIEAILKGTGESIGKLNSLVTRSEMPVTTFFNDQLRTQARFMLGLNQTLHAVAQAMTELPDKGKALKSLEEAQHSLACLRGILHDAEHDQFAGWYDGDRLFGLKHLGEIMQTAVQEMQ